MVDGYDGSVVIKTGLDLETIEKDAETLRKAIDAATKGAKELIDVSKASMEAQLTMLKNANAGWLEQLNILTKIKEAMGGGSVVSTVQARASSTSARTRTVQTTGPVETEEWTRAQKELERLTIQVDKTLEKMNKMEYLFDESKQRLADRIAEKTAELEQISDKIMTTIREKGDYKPLLLEQANLKEELANLEKQTDDSTVQDTKAYQSLIYDLRKLWDSREQLLSEITQMEQTGGRYAEQVTEKTAEESAGVEKLTERYTKLATVTKQAKQEAVKTTSAVVKHSGINFKNILKYALGIRSMFFLMRKIRAVAKEALKVVAAYDPALNATVSKLLTSVKQLKADFGTMLQPLVQTGAPILTWLIDKVSTITLGISKFFAALVGQNYIDRAKVKAVDYADALDDVADSADKASEALGGYDKLNIISGKDDGGSKGAKSTLALTKETVEYTQEALNDDEWTVKLGRRLHEIFGTAKEALETLYERLSQMEWFNSLKKKLQGILNDPDKLLLAIGILGVGRSLGRMLLKGVTESGFGTGISALIPKAAVVAIVAVVAYKLGNKIYNSLPDGLQEELADTMGGYAEAFESDGVVGVIEHFGDEFVFTLTETYAEMSNAADTFVENLAEGKLFEDQSGIPYRMPKPKAVPPTEEEKRALELQNKLYYTQLHAKTQLDLQRFIQNVKPLVAEFTVKFTEKWGITPTEAFNNIKNQLLILWSNPANPVRSAITTITDGFKTWWGNIWKTPEERVQTVKDNLAAVGRGLKSAWSGENPIKTELNSIKSSFSSWFTSAFSTGADVTATQTLSISARLAAIGEKIKSLWGAKDNPIKTALETIKTSLSSLWDSMFGTGNETGNKADTAGQSIAKKFIDGFKSIFNTDSSLDRTVAEKVTGAITSGINIATALTSGVSSAVAAGKITPTSGTATTSTTKQGDIVLKIDGKTVSKVVWDNTTKLYKQTGVSLK